MIDKLNSVLRHIENVQQNCKLLAERIVEDGGDEDFSRQLIANGLIHDNSKLNGIEWEYLHQDIKEKEPEKFNLALQQHVETNPHHPEYWTGGIKKMPSIYIAEWVCDVKTRSNEFGSALLEWIKEKATQRFDFNTSDKVYKEIKHFVDLLLEDRFS
jgi:hypothetical protein